MVIEWIICIGVVTAALLFGAVCWWRELKEREAYQTRLYNDPEFAAQHHEIHKHDDWEDAGYFDGR